MTAALTLYALAAGLLLAIVGVLADRAAALRGWPRRWIWTPVLVAAIGLPAAAPWRATNRPAATITTTMSGVRAIEQTHAAQAPATPAGLGVRIQARVDATASAAARFEPFLVAAWIAGSTLVMIVFVAGRLTIARQRRRWAQSVVRNVPVLVAPAAGPAVVGLLSPRIVLPAWVLDLDSTSVDLILRHEGEHVRAGDPWLIHVAALALLLMPWNPIVWWMVSRLRLAVELDCDSRVLGGSRMAGSRDAVAYGELLLAVVERRPRQHLLATPALVESSSSLARRIAALFPTVVRFTRTRVVAAVGSALALAALAIVVPLPRVTALSLDAAPVDASIASVVDETISREVPGLAAPNRAMPFDAVTIGPAAPAAAPVSTAEPADTSSSHAADLLRAARETVDVSPAAARVFDGSIGAVAELSAPPSMAPATPAFIPARVGPYRNDTPGLIAPEPVRVVRPRYTNAAMRERISGSVVVEAVVGADGRVDDARLITSLDSEFGLDEAAIEAAKESLFRPGSINGEPVPVAIMMELSFAIH